MAEKYIKASECEKYFYEHLDDNGLIGAMNAIDEMPAADVQPVKRGKLEERIGYGGWGDTYYHCSVCGSDWIFEEGTPKANEWNFCPHCGADVRSPDATKG